MKKTLFALLFLLFLLIIACVYQKTYTLYSMQTTQEELVVIVDETHASTIEKEEIQTVVKETPTHKKKALHQAIVETEIAVTKAPENKEKTSFVEKIKAKVVETFTPSQELVKEEKVIAVKKIVSHTPEVSKEEMKKVETEAVDYLLTVLQEHKAALSERDAAESRLHALIEQVLEDRKKAISSMEEVATSSANAQVKRIEKRDQTSQTIIQNNTKGE